MEFYNEPDITWNEWLYKACFIEDSLTELGTFIAPSLKNGIFINAPCGYELPNDEFSIEQFVKNMGVATYREVDYDAKVLGTRLKQSPRVEHNYTAHTHQSDILTFFTHYARPQSCVVQTIYISGLQPKQEFISNQVNQATKAVPYLHNLYAELYNKSALKDLVIINDPSALACGIYEKLYPGADPIIGLTQQGFTLKRRCKYNKICVLQKCI